MGRHFLSGRFHKKQSRKTLTARRHLPRYRVLRSIPGGIFRVIFIYVIAYQKRDFQGWAAPRKGNLTARRCCGNRHSPSRKAPVCGSGPAHKYGRPGDRVSCDAQKAPRRPVISTCRRQFSDDPLLAPGFLKGPAGPLSRAPRLGTRGGFLAYFFPR